MQAIGELMTGQHLVYSCRYCYAATVCYEAHGKIAGQTIPPNPRALQLPACWGQHNATHASSGCHGRPRHTPCIAG